MSFTAVLLDDEVESLELLNHFISDYCQNIQVLAMCDNFKDGFQKITTLKPDIVFLDIVLGPLEDSFQLLELISDQNIKVIFITAHEDFAAKAFRFSAIDYLLKPIKISQLVSAVEKAVHVLNIERNLLTTAQIAKQPEVKVMPRIGQEIQIQTKGKQVFCNIQDILYFEAFGQITYIFLQNGTKIESNKTLGVIEEGLDKNLFMRIHKSFTVNVQFVTAIISKNGSFVELSNSIKVPLSRRKKKEISLAIREFKLG